MKSVLVYGLMRGGSSITFDVIRRLYEAAGGRYDDVVQRLYREGYPLEEAPDEDRRFADEGVVYGPFRMCPEWLRRHSRALPLHKIMIVRDPRDCLVSHHHIQRATHSRFVHRSGNTTPNPNVIDRAPYYPDINVHVVVWARFYRIVLQQFSSLCAGDPRIHVYRYEDILSDFPGWVDDVCALLKLTPTAALDEQKAHLKSTIALEREEVDRDAHHRRGAAGGFVDELCAEAIDELNDQFRDVLTAFGYHQLAIRRGFLAARPTIAMGQDGGILDAFRHHFALLDRENGFRIEEISSFRARVAALEALARPVADALDAPDAPARGASGHRAHP